VPIYEFICGMHGKFEKIMPMGTQVALCERSMATEKGEFQCGEECKKVEFSVPAKRNPRYGEGG